MSQPDGLLDPSDYIESANILFTTFKKIKQEDYLNNYVIPTICDWPGQINLRKAITLRLNKKDNSGISSQILNLLDNSLPLTLEIYAKLFRYRFYKGYLESIVKIWGLFQKLQRHNYNKAPLIFLSDVSLKYQTVELNSDNQIIQKAKIIDIERNDKGFKKAFINTRNTNISKVKIVNIKVLPLAWSTSNPPTEDKFYDAENCNITDSLSNIVLICGHSYHKKCLSILNEKCKYCFNYLSKNIKTNITSLNKRLFKPLKDNEIPEITKDDDLNKDYEDENIETLLK
ncbi:hypothetical protein GLOIN_2v1782578 [Rhizophagus irregularis DAOM 181602=DAOM 197198]|nr:hypothetical protein GLOIN_2v1782578 [Rhizophagus irregularis DAOM 181602=DAOM 197198]